MVEVHLRGSAPNGFATLLAGIVEAAAAADPAVARLLETTLGAAQIELRDRGEVVGLALVPGALTVTSSPIPGADVRIRADVATLLGFAAVPLRRGLPDITTAAGRAVVADVVRGRLRLRGGPSGLRVLRVVNRLISTA